MKISIPIRIRSEANLQEHWSKKYRRKKEAKQVIRYYLNVLEKPKFPCKITLTRIAPRALDTDNLWAAMKTPTDIVADWLIPGLEPGRADGDKRIEFDCKQKKGRSKEYAIEIEICSQNGLE